MSVMDSYSEFSNPKKNGLQYPPSPKFPIPWSLERRSALPDLYPERVCDGSHHEGYDSAWYLRTVYSTFKQSLFCVLMSQYRRIKL